MRNEVSSAVDFLSNIMNNRGLRGILANFKENLSDILCEHYQNHWFPEKPFKGSAYRCIRITNNKMDPLLEKAGAGCGITASQLLAILPRELTMWVDPEEVAYRIGEDGSIGVLYDGATEPVTSAPEPVVQQQPQTYVALEPAQSHTTQDFFQTCKDQLRYIPGMTVDPVHFDYFSTFVAS